jgi:hypothetical protein
MDWMASRKGRCTPLILWHKKGVFRFAKIARLTASAVRYLITLKHFWDPALRRLTLRHPSGESAR